MATKTAISNMALGHIGSATRVTSIDPPDGSVEADRCAMFYPHAMRVLIETTEPSSAKLRTQLTEVANLSLAWAYAYAKPSACIKPLRILRSSAAAVAQATIFEAGSLDPLSAAERSLHEEGSADYMTEGEVIYSNEPEAVLVYLAEPGDSTRLTPMLAMALSYMLASLLAGGTIKGRVGAQTARSFYDLAISYGKAASSSDANGASSSTHQVIAPWMAGRE